MKNILLFLLLLIAIGTSYSQGPAIIGSSLTITGEKSQSGLSSNQDNYVLPGGFHVYFMEATTPVNITGLSYAGQNRNGQTVVLHNTSASAITFKHQDEGSLAGNRILLSAGVDLVIGLNQSVRLRYSGTLARWCVDGSLNAVGAIAAPSEQASGVAATAITNNSATLNWVNGDGTAALVFVVDGDIFLPEENVSYTADANFGDGDRIGATGPFVVFNGVGTSVNLTGLSAGTSYIWGVLSYTQQGGAIRYNTTITQDVNLSSVLTLASDETPTVQVTFDSLYTKEDSIVVRGTRGNGVGFIALMKQADPVDGSPVDDTEYTSGLFGVGNQIGTGNFVTHSGTSADFTMGGFTRDIEYSFPEGFEHSNTFKYLVSSGTDPPTIRTAYVYQDEWVAGVAEPAGKADLEARAKVYYDFLLLEGATTDVILTGDAGLVDYGPGTNNGEPDGSPQVKVITIGADNYKTVRTLSAQNIIADAGGGGQYVASDAEVIIHFQHNDGIQSGGTHRLWGREQNSVTTSAYALLMQTTGQLEVRYRTPSHDFMWRSTAALLADGVNTNKVLRVKFDFTNDIFGVFLDEQAVAGSVTTGSFASVNPATWDNGTTAFRVGNASGFGDNPATDNSILHFAVMPILTSPQAENIFNYMTFTDVGDLSDIGRWVFSESVGFTEEIVDGKLHMSGNPLGWEDFGYHVDFFPDSLEEFKLEKIVKLGALSTSTAGIGLGIRNDLATEANWGVVGEFITDTDHPNFGHVFLYSGTGASDPTAFAFRSMSGGAHVPAEDDEYLFTFERNRQGNDAFYSITVKLLGGDSLEITTGWTEPNSPSTAFFGSTQRAWIHQNGGDHTIRLFAIRRTGSQFGGGGSEPPPPPPTGHDINVQKTGNDVNDCTTADPCLTLVRGRNRAVELGGTNKTMFIGAGTYTENSFIMWPTNLSLIEGAGMDVTIITGGGSVQTNPAFTQNSSRFLIQASSSSRITGNHTIKNLTLSGANRTITGGLFINNRDEIVIDNVKFDRFGFTGLWLAQSKTGEMRNFQFISSGGSSSSGSFSTGNFVADKLEEWTFRDGTIDASQQGTGYGFKTLRFNSSSNNTFKNVYFHDIVCTVFPRGGYIDASGNTIANISFEFHGNFQVPVGFGLEIYNCTFNEGFLSFGSSEGTAAQNGTRKVHDNIFLRNLSNSGSGIESHGHHIEIYNNWFTGAFPAGHLMWTTNIPSGSGDGVNTYTGWNFHHNVARVGSSSFAMGVVASKGHRIIDGEIKSNTIIFTTSSGAVKGLFHSQQTSGTGSNFEIYNNALSGQSSTNNMFSSMSGSGLTNTFVRNNKATHMNTLQVISGVTGGSGNGNTTGHSTLGFQNFGVQPNPFFKPVGSSVLIGTGYPSGDVGAIQGD